MANHERGAYYRALKEAGVDFSKPFRQLSLDELKQAYDRLDAEGLAPKLEMPPEKSEEAQMWKEPQAEAVTRSEFDALVASIQGLTEVVGNSLAARRDPALDATPQPAPVQKRIEPAPVMQQAPATIAREATVHERPRSLPDDEPLYTDENGVQWFRREVRKPAFPKPRGRRVLTYVERGVEQKTVTNGQYVETVEVASESGPARTAEVKITLPSFQTGIYKDPRMPFKIHIYNEVRGFDLFDIWDYFGGESLVPEECKRMYVSNDLCYDMRSVINYIEAEHRRLQLQGRTR